MKLHKLFAALILMSTALSSSAFAIDQVILKNGQIIEGKVLSEVANRHVDIQLINGNKRRYQQSDVASVERDVPSNSNSRMSGSTSEIYLGAQLGMLLSLETAVAGVSNSAFTWGARGGINVAQLGDFSKFAVGLSFGHVEKTIGTTTIAGNSLLAQLLFRKVGNSGFYFGPEFGLDFISGSDSTSPNVRVTGTPFMFGVDLGYDYYLSDGFSIGPDFHYQNISNYTLSSNSTTTTASVASAGHLLIQLTGTFHF